MLVNGVYVRPDQRGTRTLNEGDVLVIWPPVAGGQISAAGVSLPRRGGLTASVMYIQCT
jgi:hypothetical protein